MEIKDEKLSRDKWETCKAACDRLSCKISQNQSLLYWFTELCVIEVLTFIDAYKTYLRRSKF